MLRAGYDFDTRPFVLMDLVMPDIVPVTRCGRLAAAERGCPVEEYWCANGHGS